MSKARYIIDSLDKDTTKGRAKEILSHFFETERDVMKAQDELLVFIQDLVKKNDLDVEVEKDKGASIKVTGDRNIRKTIDSALFKKYGHGYKVTANDKLSNFELKIQ